ncbi:MAG: protein kinase, partial [Myxococcota bacterium]
MSEDALGATSPQSPQICPSCGASNNKTSKFCHNCGHALRAPERPPVEEAEEGTVADPLVGRVIADRYEIQGLLGRGGMGVVYKVEHVHIGKLMAMKLLHGELARDRDTIKRFRREAEAASRLNHPNTVQIFDFGRDEGLMYLTMEYVEGHDFGWVIQHEGPLDLARVARICAQVSASVGQAHAEGIVHRDIKPENVMVVAGRDDREVVKVLDFGLAKLRHQDAGLSLTQAGSIIGTPYYMAPEHIRGDDVDPRADIYSVGAMMYKALVGVPPFWASSPMGVLTKHLTDEVIPPSTRVNRPVPPAADAIVLKAMEKDADRRYQTMEELRADLLGYLASIGEELHDSHLSIPSGAPVLTASGRQRVMQVATKDDVDGYERRIKRKGWVGAVVALLAVVGLAVGGYWFFTHRPTARVDPVEIEPNETTVEATVLPRSITYEGFLGQRQGPRLGDADVYRIENPAGRRRAIAVEVTGIPNIDLAFDVVRAGNEQPVLVAD